MDKILHYLKDPKLWELRYIPYYGSCRILSINRSTSPQRDPNPQTTIKSRANCPDRGAEQDRQLTLEVIVSFLHPDKQFNPGSIGWIEH